MASGWTAGDIETASRMWREGYSASDISRVLDGRYSRNAVVAKVHRMRVKQGGAKPLNLRLPRQHQAKAAPATPTRRLGFKAGLGPSMAFAFTADHDRKIIAALVHGIASRIVAPEIGCTLSQFNTRREALKRYHFVVRNGTGWQPAAGIDIGSPPPPPVREKLSAYGNNKRRLPGMPRPTVYREPPIHADTPPAARDAKGEFFTLLTVRNGQCRYPYGDTRSPEFHVCGLKAERGSWCPFHHARVHPPKPAADGAA